MASRNQPTYDFLTGGTLSPMPASRAKKHEDYRQNQALPEHLPVEELHARIRTLEYEVATLKQEKEVTQLQHDQDLREAHGKADEDFRRSQKFENASTALQKRYDSLLSESREEKSRLVNDKSELERRIRIVDGQKRALEEERDEAVEQLSNFERENGRKEQELEARNSALRKSLDLLKADFETQSETARNAQQKLAESEASIGQLEAQVVALKTSGGSEEADVIKRQLSEQVVQIKRLEKSNRTQLAELNELKKIHKSVEVVEEEKRGLEARLKMMDTLRDQLSQAQLRVQVLEEARNSWASYLESQSAEEQFESPQDMARAFMQQRIENASLVEQLGAVKPELSIKDEAIRSLDEERSKLQGEIAHLKAHASTSGGLSDAKARARLERQKTLAVKETEYLRAQLKAMDDEQQEFNSEHFSEETSKKVKDLQDLVDEYRHELDRLHADLSAKDPNADSPPSPKKRALEENTDERLGELLRKTRKLQEELQKTKTRNEILEAESKAQSKQLNSYRSDKSSRHRILELRNNPTAQIHAIKQSTLTALSEENETLRAQLEGSLPVSGLAAKDQRLIPAAQLTTLQLALQERDQLVASREKSQKRLREIFSAKALEFREAVFSLLGWKLEFQPNGRVKATSMFYPQPARKSRREAGGQQELEEDAEEEGNFIVFDGENATMKVSGGVKSEFAKEIRGLIEFWVEGRGQVPCLLAAMTLEFFDRYHDQKK